MLHVHVWHSAQAGLAGLTNSLGQDGAGCGHNRGLVVPHVFQALGVAREAGLGGGGGSIDCRVGGVAVQSGLGAVGIPLLPLAGLVVLLTRVQVCGCGCWADCALHLQQTPVHNQVMVYKQH